LAKVKYLGSQVSPEFYWAVKAELAKQELSMKVGIIKALAEALHLDPALVQRELANDAEVEEDPNAVSI
jgi:hypothetical protein